jgi:23S rRNA (cytosine1962-C5)-methyltransferase
MEKPKVRGRIVLKKGKEHSAERFHPWIFSGAIQMLEGEVLDGCWVEVVTHQQKTVGYGHYQNGSIAVRLLTFKPETPDETFWANRLEAAINLRSKAGLPSETTNAYRLIHAEGDGLPGLIIDYYDGVAIIQAHSIGMHLDRFSITEAVTGVLGQLCKAVYYKSQSTLPGKAKDFAQNEYLAGMAAVPHVIVENANRFYVDWEEGQKTGFFLDQRENRRLLGDFCRGKNVLNTFCYTGGFSVYALQAGALNVHSVDASEKAVELTRRNIQLNGYDPVQHVSIAADTFDYLKDKGDQYDVIILDPPAFAKHRDARHQAVRGYQRLNAEAMRVIRKGGIIFTFSFFMTRSSRLRYRPANKLKCCITFLNRRIIRFRYFIRKENTLRVWFYSWSDQ